VTRWLSSASGGHTTESTSRVLANRGASDGSTSSVTPVSSRISFSSAANAWSARCERPSPQSPAHNRQAAQPQQQLHGISESSGQAEIPQNFEHRPAAWVVVNTNLENVRLPGPQRRGKSPSGRSDPAPAAYTGPKTAPRTASARRQTARHLRAPDQRWGTSVCHKSVMPTCFICAELRSDRTTQTAWAASLRYASGSCCMQGQSASGMPRLCNGLAWKQAGSPA
jgi:hypothetical protein